MKGINSQNCRKLAIIGALFIITAVSTRIHAADITQPYMLIGGHTAGVLPRSYFDLDLRVYAADGYGTGLITGVRVGITDRLMLGVGYGGEGLIGRGGNVRWYRYPGVVVKYRVFDEQYVSPGVTVGFDNQGHGGPAGVGDYGYDGYVYKSPGFFLAVSKNYIMFNTVQIGFHGTVNYSLEEVDNVTWPNALGGIDIGINDELALIFEYNFALDDITGRDERRYALPWRGFLNIGLRWAFTENFHLEFDVRDVLENKTRRASTLANPDRRVPIGWSRELKVVYITKF